MATALPDIRGDRVTPERVRDAGTTSPEIGTLDTLTVRESEILAWVTRGLTNRDVAGVLGVSARTVQKHLEHIYQKLGVETRTAAAACAWSAVGGRAR